ncbi:MAG TPA: NAD(P)/FAD-dependent oxidoreductase, partial [Acidimicrobiales bacterium]|nr:NAD(P)/FAD-dependent oxidoreductase [Acidimicrobiales bacterium]
LASSFFRRFGLEARGVRLLQPEIPFAQPLVGGDAAVAFRGVEETAASFGNRADGDAYRRLFEPLVRSTEAISDAALSSYRAVPGHPAHVARFALSSLRSAQSVARRFETPAARGLIAGVAAHAMQPLDAPLTGGIALLLSSLAHGVGWPLAGGGSGQIVDAMLAELSAHGVEVRSGERVRSLAELPAARAVLLDVSPRAVEDMADGRLPARYARQLRHFRYGPGVCKVDWALDGPVPWTAEICRRAGTLHLGGTFEEVASSERDVAAGRHPERPYVLTVQPGVVDTTRAPEGKHTLWTYCHVPSGSDKDMGGAIASQIERFAPGFTDLVLARSVRTARAMEEQNANYVGGDIACGARDLRQTFTGPVARWNPYGLPLPGVYLCSSATPPGPGVHGRCGELAARAALKEVFGITSVDVAPSRRTEVAGDVADLRNDSPLRKPGPPPDPQTGHGRLEAGVHHTREVAHEASGSTGPRAVGRQPTPSARGRRAPNAATVNPSLETLS